MAIIAKSNGDGQTFQPAPNRVHQAVCVQPHWYIQGDAEGRWSMVMQLALDTTLAESRRGHSDEPSTVAMHT